MDMNRLLRTLERHEGYRQFPYQCTAGRTTISIGRNLSDKGISYTEARYLLKNDIDEAREDLEKIFPGQFASLPDYVQEVMINLRFQLGPSRFRGFRKMIAAVRAWDLARAADELLDSKLARSDAPNRAKELADVLRGKPFQDHRG